MIRNPLERKPTFPTEMATLIGVSLLSFVYLLVLGIGRARLDAHTEFYLLEALQAFTGGEFLALPGPRVGPFDVHAGPIPYLPYWMALLLDQSVSSLLFVKAALNAVSVFQLGVIVRGALPQSRFALALGVALAFGMCVVLDAAALNFRYTAFIPVFVTTYLYALQRFVKPDASLGWLALATLAGGVLPCFHLLTGSLLIMLPMAMWFRRTHLVVHKRQTFLALMPGVLIAGPLFYRLVAYALGDSAASESVGTTTSAGASTVDAFLFAFHVLRSRWPATIAHGYGLIAVVFVVLGWLFLSWRAVRKKADEFELLLVVQVPLALAVFLWTGGYAQKESHLYAWAIPIFVAGGVGAGHAVSRLSSVHWYKQWFKKLETWPTPAIGLFALGIGAQLLLSPQDTGRYPPSAVLLETMVTRTMRTYDLSPSDVATRIHGFARTGDAGLRYLSVAAALGQRTAKSSDLSADQHFAYVPDYLDTAPLGAKLQARPLRPYSSVINYAAGVKIDAAGHKPCAVSLPYERATIGIKEWTEALNHPVLTALCSALGSGFDRLHLSLQLRPGEAGTVNVVLDIGGRGGVTAAAHLESGRALKVVAGELPARWPTLWFKVSVPARKETRQLDLTLRGVAGLNLLDLF